MLLMAGVTRVAIRAGASVMVIMFSEQGSHGAHGTLVGRMATTPARDKRGRRRRSRLTGYLLLAPAACGALLLLAVAPATAEHRRLSEVNSTEDGGLGACMGDLGLQQWELSGGVLLHLLGWEATAQTTRNLRMCVALRV